MKLSADPDRCDVCSGRKTSFVLRGPVRMTAVYIILIEIVIAWFVMDDRELWPFVAFAGGVVAGLLLLSLLRRRCLACEPEWEPKIWHRGR